MHTHGEGSPHVVIRLYISDILHKVLPLFSWWSTYICSPCSTVPSALSLSPSGCWTYTVRRKQREAKISPRALSLWTLQMDSFILSNLCAMSHTKHCRYICWDTGELNALYNLVCCQFLALSNLSLQEVLRTMCPFLQGFLGGPYKHQSWVNIHFLNLRKGMQALSTRKARGSQTCLQDPTLPQLITPRHSLVFCPQGSQSPTRDSACKHTHSLQLPAGSWVNGSIPLPRVCVCHCDLGFSKLPLWNPDNPIAAQYVDYQEAENLS